MKTLSWDVQVYAKWSPRVFKTSYFLSNAIKINLKFLYFLFLISDRRWWCSIFWVGSVLWHWFGRVAMVFGRCSHWKKTQGCEPGCQCQLLIKVFNVFLWQMLVLCQFYSLPVLSTSEQPCCCWVIVSGITWMAWSLLVLKLCTLRFFSKPTSGYYHLYSAKWRKYSRTSQVHFSIFPF